LAPPRARSSTLDSGTSFQQTGTNGQGFGFVQWGPIAISGAVGAAAIACCRASSGAIAASRASTSSVKPSIAKSRAGSSAPCRT